jgi:putative endonuclease
MYYVYVLFSKKDKRLYTGSTGNLVERIKRHNRGLVSSTKFRRPLKLIYYEACISRKDSMKRELYLKSAWGKRYLKNRLKDYLTEDRI